MYQPKKTLDRIEEAFAITKQIPGVHSHVLLGSAMYMPLPNDIDIGVLLDEGLELGTFIQDLAKQGWNLHGDYHGVGPTWNSVTKDGINLLVMTEPERMYLFKRAMEVCKALRIPDRVTRVAICQIVRDGLEADEVTVPKPPEEFF